MSHGLPTMDAVKSILPHFHSLYTGPRTEPVQEHVPLMISSPPVRGYVNWLGGGVGGLVLEETVVSLQWRNETRILVSDKFIVVNFLP